LDKVGNLLSHVYQNPSKSIQDVLVFIKEFFYLEGAYKSSKFDG